MNQATPLDLTSFVNALSQLKKSLKYYHSDLALHDKELKMQFAAATIQAFEFTYEISIKFLRRYLEISESSAVVISEMSFPALIRTASEKGLLKSEWAQWKRYRDRRNITSHTYDAKKAIEVMDIVPIFLKDAEYLLNRLNERLGAL